MKQPEADKRKSGFASSQCASSESEEEIPAQNETQPILKVNEKPVLVEDSSSKLQKGNTEAGQNKIKRKQSGSLFRIRRHRANTSGSKLRGRVPVPPRHVKNKCTRRSIQDRPNLIIEPTPK